MWVRIKPNENTHRHTPSHAHTLTHSFTHSYSWDNPIHGDRSIRVELDQGGSEWLGRDIALDTLAHSSSLTLLRDMPRLRPNIIEGYLERFDAEQDIWIKLYGILLTDMLYLFKDAEHGDLVCVLSMARPLDSSLQLATVEKQSHVSWDLINSITSTMGLLGLGNFAAAVDLRDKQDGSDNAASIDVNRSVLT